MTQDVIPSTDALAVLIVDAEPELTEELALALQDAGFICMAAESAEEALRMMADAPEIGVVLADVQLPGGDGTYLLHHLRENAGPDQPRRQVIMTGPAMSEGAEPAGVPPHAFAYLGKPFTLEEAINVIARASQAAMAQRTAPRALSDRSRMARDLPSAAELGQLSLLYQPVIRADRSALVGFEVRLQWSHPDLGPLPPEAFIPLAEETGATVDLEAWAVRAAAAQVAAWRRELGSAPSVSVRMSGRHLRDADVPALFAEVLHAHGLPASALVVNVTEATAIDPDAAPALRSLRQLGLLVAIEDFGAGLSCLSAFPRVPADIVTFNRVLLADPGYALFIRGLVAAMHALGLSVHAEGIETEAQLTLAREAGCSAVQGPLLGQPLPADQARLLIVRASPPGP